MIVLTTRVGQHGMAEGGEAATAPEASASTSAEFGGFCKETRCDAITNHPREKKASAITAALRTHTARTRNRSATINRDMTSNRMEYQ